MIPVFERMKTVHALDGAATVIGVHFTVSITITIRKREKRTRVSGPNATFCTQTCGGDDGTRGFTSAQFCLSQIDRDSNLFTPS
jgi:hypothetical protein